MIVAGLLSPALLLLVNRAERGRQSALWRRRDFQRSFRR